MYNGGWKAVGAGLATNIRCSQIGLKSKPALRQVLLWLIYRTKSLTIFEKWYKYSYRMILLLIEDNIEQLIEQIIKLGTDNCFGV